MSKDDSERNITGKRKKVLIRQSEMFKTMIRIMFQCSIIVRMIVSHYITNEYHKL